MDKGNMVNLETFIGIGGAGESVTISFRSYDYPLVVAPPPRWYDVTTYVNWPKYATEPRSRTGLHVQYKWPMHGAHDGMVHL